MSRRGQLIVVSGPSGAGKSTIVREVLRRTGAAFSVSATTRQPRNGEIDGRDYRFVDRTAFEKMIAADALLEWAEVFGELYGTPREPVQRAIDAGEAILLDIDVQGGIHVHEKMPDAAFVLIVPPSMDELQRRLKARGTETEEKLQRRLRKADEEITTAGDSGVYNYTVVNDDLDEAIARVEKIVKQECSKHD